jgi:hypothetical protein
MDELMSKEPPCPICWQEQVGMHCQDPASPFDVVVNEVRLTRWDPIERLKGYDPQNPGRWDDGFWGCELCGAQFTRRDLEVLAGVVFRPFPWGMTEDDWQDLNEIQSVMRGDT